jgi:hypothetical protein
MATGKEVATIPAEGLYLANYANEMQSLGDTVRENLGETGIAPRELPRIRIPAGGGSSWEVPTLEGVESMQTISGVIVHWKTMRAYWDVAFEQSDGAPPKCTSDDGIVGIGAPGVACKTCPFNQFGTADSGAKSGKACREVLALFFLAEGDTLPFFIPLPPMSIRAMRDFFARLTQRATPFWSVETKLALEQDKNRQSIRYSKAVPTLGRILNDAERARIQEYRTYIKPAIDGVELAHGDVQPND